MKVLFVTNNYTPYSGGVVQSINAFANQLEKNGIKVHIATLQYQANQQLNESNVSRIWCPIRFMYKNNHMAIPLACQLQLKHVINQFKPDIIHSHHPFLLGRAALNISKKTGIPIMFTHHTQYDHYAHYVPIGETITKPLINTLVTQYCNEVDFIIAPSMTIKKQLVQKLITKPIRVIPSPIRDIFFEQSIVKKRENKLNLITVSRFTPEKNITFLLEVVKQLPKDSYHFTLVGYGYYLNFLKYYAYQILDLCSSNITFIEKPPLQELKKLYDEADLFLFASQSETQGLVLAEAMACKAPVIALKGPGQNDIVENGVNGFLVNNQKEMNEKIELYREDLSYLRIHNTNASNTAHSYHGSNACNNLTYLYGKLLGL